MSKVDSLTKIAEPRSKKKLDIGSNDILLPSSLQSSKRHTDVIPEDLSERWFISLNTANETMKCTTQRFLRSALVPLTRRYRVDRMYKAKRITSTWSTDTIDGRTKSLDGNHYAQMFANEQYLAKFYPVGSNGKSCDALKGFCREFCIPDNLHFDRSKEQGPKNNECLKRRDNQHVDYHNTEPDHPKQNPGDGLIQEFRCKLYRVIVCKRVPTQLWDFSISWITDIMSLAYTSVGDITRGIPRSRLI